MQFKSWGLLVLLGIFCSLLKAQDCTLQFTGQIIDEHDNDALAFANIYIPSIERGAVCNEAGFFQIKNLCPGTYTFILSHLGCKRDTIELSLNTSIEATYYLEHHTEELKQVQIVGSNTNTPQTLAIEKLEQLGLKTAQTNNLAMMLEGVSGVSTLQTGNNIAKPVIHGMHSNRIVLIIDGIKQEGQQWGAEHGPEFDVNLLDNVEIIKGGASVLYGADAIGGAIILNKALLKTDGSGLSGNLQSGFTSNGIGGNTALQLDYAPAKIKNLAIRFQGSLRRAGNVKTPEVYLENTGLKEANYSWTIKKLGKNSSTEVQYQQYNATSGIFKGAHIGNLSDLENAIAGNYQYPDRGFSYNLSRPRQQVVHETTVFKRIQSVGTGSAEIIIARQFDKRQEYDSEAGKSAAAREADKPQLELNLTTWDVQLKYRNTWKGIKYQVGTQYNNKQNTYSGRYFIPSYILNNYALYAQANTEYKGIDLEFGLRGETQQMQVFFPNNIRTENTKKSFSNAVAYIGLSKALNKSVKASFNTGTSYRPPQVTELFAQGLHNGTASIEEGNEALNSEQSWNNSLTIRLEQRNFSLALTGYVNYFKNYIALQSAAAPALTVKGAFLKYTYQQTEAVYTGLDVDARYQIKDYCITANYSLIRAFALPNKENLPFISPDFAHLNVERHIGTKKGTLTAMLKAEWHNKQSRIPDIQFAKDEQGKVVSSNALVLKAPSAYTLLHTQFTWQSTGDKPIEIGIGVNNLLNTKYRQYTNRLRYFSDEVGRYFYTNIKFKF